ncbi:FAD-dependent oxidoreductase [Sinimarinibacterium thermocellulolyticum]|uniref:FAD-dependent oxidoreductase n=1 Tax=Sinimarinibacterium thermocellulolyticum TaxID=3170016 RepID=A0ABV2A7W5_9GAMM
MALTHVLTPLRIGAVELKNRVVRPAHGTMIGAGSLNEDLIAYHEARAKGGAALSIVEIMGVHPSSIGSLDASDPRLNKMYPKFVERMHAHGMKIFQQLWHGGHNVALPPLDGSPPWSASDIPGLTSGIVPTPMTKAMIDEVIEAFTKAARSCESWGVDGVEIHCAHGYLPAQFLSANTNNRQDEYGGDLENRARFIRELLSAVRASVSRQTVVGVRVAPDAVRGGAGVDEYRYVVQMLEALGLIDYVNISMGNYQSFPKMIGGMHEPVGYELETSKPVAAATRLPTMVVGRFRTLEEADQVIRAGEADMVGFVRAMIADPDLVKKTVEGHPERVRPCIACNQGCVGGIFQPLFPRMGCTVNPAVGFEAGMGEDKLLPAAKPKRIVVIGGGPAGMEAARVAAQRGHRVVLFEAQPKLGGALRLAAMAPTRAGILDIAVWQEEELYRLGVDIRLNSYADVDDIRREQPDQVVLATGSLPRTDGIQLSNPGEPIEFADGGRIISSHDLLLDSDRDLGRTAVVVDDLGHYEAVACAEQLAVKGVRVTYVSRHNSFAPLVETALMSEPALARLQRHAFSLQLRTRAVRVEPGAVWVRPTYVDDRKADQKLEADTVVFVSHNAPNKELYPVLVEAGLRVDVLGDARSPRFAQTAIREGYFWGAML